MTALHTVPSAVVFTWNVAACAGAAPTIRRTATATASGEPRHFAPWPRTLFGARTTIASPWTLSSTSTPPTFTVVSCRRHVSSTSHRVPRTVAALYLPAVRNAPLPSPQSLRFLGFFCAAEAPALRAVELLGQREVVMPLDCVTLNNPS